MKKNIIAFVFLSACHLMVFSQDISNKFLRGVWEVSEVRLDSNSFDTSNIHNFNKNLLFFEHAKFLFSKNGLIKIESSEKAFPPFDQNIVNTTFYFDIDNNIISVGSWKKSSNIIYIQAKRELSQVIFNFCGGLVKLKKIENDCKLRVNKQALKSKTSFLMQKPLIHSSIDEDSIVDKNIDQPLQTYNCTQNDDEKLLKRCVAHTITWFFNRKFNMDIASEIGLSGRFENDIHFVIDKEGNVVNIEVDSRNPELSAEIKRTVNLLPKFIPARQNGKPINTQYSFPLIFQILD